MKEAPKDAPDDAALLLAVLDATGWSQAELGRRARVHRQTVQKWTKGIERPRHGVFADLAAELSQMHGRISPLLPLLTKRAQR